MKIKSGFILHSLGEEHVVVPVEDRTREFQGLVRLNKTGVFLWEQMQDEFTVEKLIAALLESYEVSEEEAARNVEDFVDKLSNEGIIEK